MKKIQLLILAVTLLSSLNSSGQSMTFSFANPKISNAVGVDYFEFDVLAKVSVPTYFYTGEVILNFDNTALSTNLADWSVTKGPLLSGFDPLGTYFKYSFVNTITGSPSVYNLFITSDVSSLPNGADPGY